MIDWREYETTGDYNQMVVIRHSVCGDETGGAYSQNPTDTLQELINWAIDHEERVH